MSYEPGAIDAALAAALGDDHALIVELRSAFREGAEQAVAAMATAVDAEGWTVAARRLKGLAASFGALSLMTLATTAEARPRDEAVLRRLRSAVGDL